MATPETTAKTETIPANVVAKDESATLTTSVSRLRFDLLASLTPRKANASNGI